MHTIFTNSKSLLASAPVLRLPDLQQPFVVETDASNVGIGAVLSQEQHLIAYFSKKFLPRIQVASTYQKDMFTITCAIAKW